MTTLDLCQEYFGTRDIYKLLNLKKDASPADIKKAYYKLSLLVHPDRVSESEKKTATVKFQVLSKIYQVLSDEEKRGLYNEQGIIDDENDMEAKLSSWLDLWRQLFKPITEEDIVNYEKSYIDSELERSDIKKAYISGKGCIDYMITAVPFLKVTDEPRVQQIIGEMIASDEVPEYSIFTNEPAQKRSRRHKKYEREFREAEKLKKKLSAKRNATTAASSSNDNNLEQQIIGRQRSRESNFNSLLDKLMDKYGDDDDSEGIDINDLGKRRRTRSSKSTPSKKKETAVKNGKVKRKN